MTKEQFFWQWFKKNEAKYFFFNKIDDDEEKEKILNELLAQLHIYCENLFFEVGGHPDQKQDLIITAGGDPDFFDKAELLVKHAPKFEFWNVIALKPIKEDSAVEFDGIKLSAETMYFIPLISKKSEKIGLRIYIDNLNPIDNENFLTATYLVLDNLLGEKSNVLNIGHVELENLPPFSQRKELIELGKLLKYITWKKKRETH